MEAVDETPDDTFYVERKETVHSHSIIALESQKVAPIHE